jgi:hypothetical protein
MNEVCFADDNGKDEVSVALIDFILVLLVIGFVSDIN